VSVSTEGAKQQLTLLSLAVAAVLWTCDIRHKAANPAVSRKIGTQHRHRLQTARALVRSSNHKATPTPKPQGRPSDTW